MRLGAGLLAVVLALLVVAWNARQALRPSRAAVPDLAASSAGGQSAQNPTPQQQVQSFQNALQQAVDQGAAARASDAP